MNTVLTGCDRNTEWQLLWFLTNLRKHNPSVDILIADFGMTPSFVDKVKKEYNVFSVTGGQGWFLKPVLC